MARSDPHKSRGGSAHRAWDLLKSFPPNNLAQLNLLSHKGTIDQHAEGRGDVRRKTFQESPHKAAAGQRAVHQRGASQAGRLLVIGRLLEIGCQIGDQFGCQIGDQFGLLEVCTKTDPQFAN